MATPTSPPTPTPEILLMQMVFGKAVTQAVSVAARFKIADQLVVGPEDRGRTREAKPAYTPDTSTA